MKKVKMRPDTPKFTDFKREDDVTKDESLGKKQAD
jgi:hypothetical protein